MKLLVCFCAVLSTTAIRKVHDTCSTLKARSHGGGMEFITDPNKRAEITAQIAMIAEGPVSSYRHLFAGDGNLLGRLGWGGETWGKRTLEYWDVVPLSDLLMWHPVRGPGERPTAGDKTTERANNMKNAIMNHEVTYSIEEPFKHWNEVPFMNSSEPVAAIVFEHHPDIDKSIQTFASKMDPGRSIQSALFLSSHVLLARAGRRTKRNFVLTAGQGRLQAIKEAVDELKIPPQDFFIYLLVAWVPEKWTEAFMEIRRWYVSAAKVDDNFNSHLHNLDGMSEFRPVGHVMGSNRVYSKDELSYIALDMSSWEENLKGWAEKLHDTDSYITSMMMRASGEEDVTTLFHAADHEASKMAYVRQVLACAMEHSVCECQTDCGLGKGSCQVNEACGGILQACLDGRGIVSGLAGDGIWKFVMNVWASVGGYETITGKITDKYLQMKVELPPLEEGISLATITDDGFLDFGKTDDPGKLTKPPSPHRTCDPLFEAWFMIVKNRRCQKAFHENLLNTTLEGCIRYRDQWNESNFTL